MTDPRAPTSGAPAGNRPAGGPPPVPDLSRHALFLDFDGTLVDIAPRPDDIRIPEILPGLLTALDAAAGGAIALVSGRRLADLRGFLPEFRGVIVGSHGSETWPEDAAPAPGLRQPDAGPVRAALRALAATRAAYLFEEKPAGAVIHFRADPALDAEARAAAEAVVAAHPGFALQRAKMAYEIHPAGVSKDRAVARLMDRAPFRGRVPVFAGDDTTDEPALGWVRAREGISVHVGDRPDTAAAWRLDSPAALRDWLARAVSVEERG
ncbi:trehalose-phosphatase (plasmid) [Paroceanicella profunda]|uniref:Trehalose 6-phosphate phosphatase n=1 Tax=Paroceanicella profunda TaxID=2579971 RepID=A0A5B8G4S9_9RHOB|nr:trehalose-phosphatase [Paroceanicella profunda]QDL94459.1 trehalose-phosphatase [Paroceanicella profunda]